MGNIRVEVNREGIAQLLKDPGVAADLERRARNIAAAAGPGMEVEPPFEGARRVRVTVRTGTYAAREAEAKNRALTRAIDAGRS